VAATVVAIAGLAACTSADASEASTAGPPVTEAPAAPTTEIAPTIAAAPTTEAPAPTAAPTTTVAPATTVPAPVPLPAPALPTSVAATLVTRVVDGDTVEVSTGAKIRLIGIDTPEVGQCGYGPAAQRLQALVAGQGVTLTPGARDDMDRYGRLLRYLDVAGADAGYTLVQEGLAIARYDSRDGYGRHARQDLYVAADTVSASVCAAPAAPVAPAAPAAPAAGGTDPDFGTCKAAKANGYGPYYQGTDPEYNWYRDADSDGIVCE
jgi:endonuclease YncB( thermonuclease family)